MTVLGLATQILATAPGPIFDNPDTSGELPFFANPITTIRDWAGEFLVEIAVAGVVIAMVMLIVGQITGRAWVGAGGFVIAIIVAVVVGLNSGTFLNYFVTQPTPAALTAYWVETPRPTL